MKFCKYHLPRRPFVWLALLTLFCALIYSELVFSRLPQQSLEGELTARVRETDGRVLLLENITLYEATCSSSLKGRVRFTLNNGSAVPLPGETVLVSAILKPLQEAENPFGWDERTLFFTDQVLYCASGELLNRSGRESLPLLFRIRLQVREQIQNLWPDEEQSLLKALLLGEKSDLSDEMQSAFRRSGASHLLAVSGLHVGFVAAIVLLLLHPLRRASWGRLIPTALFLAVYAWIAESGYSVFRAVLMICAMQLAQHFGRRSDLPTSLSCAVLVDLLLCPMDVRCVGFLLSTCAAAGILLFFDPLNRKLQKLIPSDFLRQSLVLTFTAQLGALPVQIRFFHSVSLLSPLTNLVAVPLAGGAVMTGLPAVLLSFLLPGAGSILAFPARIFVRLLSLFCGEMSALSFASLDLPSPSGLTLLSFYGLLFLLSPYLRQHRRPQRIFLTLTITITFAVSLFLWLPGYLERRKTSEIDILSVGTADSILLRSQSGTALIDTGRTGSQALRALQGDGLSADVIFLTHEDHDHSGGLENLLENASVGCLCIPKGMPREKLREAFTVAEEKKIPVRELSAGETLTVGSYTFQVLWPEQVRPEQDNADSMVLLAECYGQRLLFLSDISKQVETLLPLVPCDVVKLAHHGSAGSTGEDMLRTVQPDAAVLSLGTPNAYGFPSEEVLERLRAAQVPVYRTDTGGAIRVLPLPTRSLIFSYSPPDFIDRFFYGRYA